MAKGSSGNSSKSHPSKRGRGGGGGSKRGGGPRKHVDRREVEGSFRPDSAIDTVDADDGGDEEEEDAEGATNLLSYLLPPY